MDILSTGTSSCGVRIWEHAYKIVIREIRCAIRKECEVNNVVTVSGYRTSVCIEADLTAVVFLKLLKL